jgi:hypothetical protein
MEKNVLLSIFGEAYKNYYIGKSVDYTKENVVLFYCNIDPHIQGKYYNITNTDDNRLLKQWIFLDVKKNEYYRPSGRYLLQFLFTSLMMKYIKLSFIDFYKEKINGKEYFKSLINEPVSMKEINELNDELVYNTN